MEKISPQSVVVKLENKDLWDKFNTFGTEMVITKTGRRMFPFLEVSIEGLEPDETYMVILDITKVDDRRYKYYEKDNHWRFVDTRLLSPTPAGMFVHSLCPCSGSEICGQRMLFNKVKLTNNPHTVSFGNILLDSMCRYVPRLSFITYSDYHNQRWENGVAFMFKETEFIAVTAYMNKEITKLKIDNNPFARAFRENGLKGKGLQNISTSSGSSTIEKEQTDEGSNETASPMDIIYRSNDESNDGIQVLHVSPSSIIVTDVLPSSLSTSSLMATSNLPSSPNMPSTSEANAVFATFGNAATATEERVSQTSSYKAENIELDSLLYPTTASQNITVEKSGFITGETFGGTRASSSRVGFAEGDILCKVIDVRSIRETPPSDKQGNNTRMISSLKSFGGENENHIDEMRNRDSADELSSSNTPSQLTRKTTGPEDICEDTNVFSTMEKLVNSSTCEKRVTRENECDNSAEGVEQRKFLDSVDAGPDKVQKQRNEKEIRSNNRVEDNTSRGDVDRDCVKESNEELPTEAASKPQISKLLNFVNSVSMPGVLKFGTKKTLVSRQDKNNSNLPKKSLETLPLLGQKRSVGDRPAVEPKKARKMEHSSVDQSMGALKSLDQSDKRLRTVSHSNVTSKTMSQSKDSLETLNQSEKRSSDILKSVDQSEGMAESGSRSHEATKSTNPPNKIKSSISDSTTMKVKIKKEYCNESPRYVQEQRRNSETLEEKTAENEEKTAKGIPTTVIDVGHEERIKCLVPNGVHFRNSLYRTKYLEQTQGNKERCSGLQGSSQVNSTRNKDPSCLEKDNGMNQVVRHQNGALVESASKSFPVILSSYSIHPSKFSNQQRNIDLNNETSVVVNYENRIPVVYPAENFYHEENQDKEVLEKCSNNKTETRCEPKLVEGKKEASVKSNSNYRKIFPKPIPLRANYTLTSPQEFIDLSSSMNDNFYQRQSEILDHNYLANKGVPLQVLYTFETKMSLGRAPDPRLPEVYRPTRTTFTGYASNLICSTLPIATSNKGFQPVSGKY